MLDQITREKMNPLPSQSRPFFLVCFWSYYDGVSLFGTIFDLKTPSFILVASPDRRPIDLDADSSGGSGFCLYQVATAPNLPLPRFTKNGAFPVARSLPSRCFE